MRVIRARDYSDASRRAAEIISDHVTRKPDCVLGLATGSSPLGIYAQLIAWYKNGDIDFSRTKAVNLDEYVGLPADHDQSYAWFMRRNFFDHINIDIRNTYIPNGMEYDEAGECARYDGVLKALGGVDLQLLGLGVNGHIGFNEPSEAFSEGTHCVELTQTTIEANSRFFARKADVPRKAYSMGIRDIMAAKRVVMIVTGAQKARAVRDCFCGPVTPRVPGSVLQLHPDFTLVADEEALSLADNIG